MGTEEPLLDTFPGRIFIEQLRTRRLAGMSISAYIAAMLPEELVWCATSAVGRYLYSDDCLNVLHLHEEEEPELRETSIAGLAALRALSTFDSPQIHQGKVGELRTPSIRNRDGFSALPAGAFWTSTPLNDDEDSWTVSGQHVHHIESPRWEVYFDINRVQVARIDSAQDWIELIDSHAVTVNGCKYPDWPSLAESWDAVHLSPAGLLLAHPTISATPFITTDGSGFAHSQAGPYASVAAWSVISTAWLRTPPEVKLRQAPN